MRVWRSHVLHLQMHNRNVEHLWLSCSHVEADIDRCLSPATSSRVPIAQKDDCTYLLASV